MVTKLKIGILGICPVCEGEFKVREGKLVHHGFTRPGDGMIHGDCFAVAYEPYERSTLGCVNYKNLVEQGLGFSQNYLARLQAGTVTHFSEIVGRGWNTEVIEYAAGVTCQVIFNRKLDEKIHETEYKIRQLTSEISRMDRLITAWSLKDLREVTEEAAASVLKAERDARKAEKDAKNAAKAEKAAALKAKRDAREAVREAAFQTFIDDLTALDASDKTKAEKQRLGLMRWFSFFSEKTKRQLGDVGNFYYEFRKRNLDSLLLRLDMVTREGSEGWIRYPRTH